MNILAKIGVLFDFKTKLLLLILEPLGALKEYKLNDCTAEPYVKSGTLEELLKSLSVYKTSFKEETWILSVINSVSG